VWRGSMDTMWRTCKILVGELMIPIGVALMLKVRRRAREHDANEACTMICRRYVEKFVF
jgi:hypothetical protein